MKCAGFASLFLVVLLGGCGDSEVVKGAIQFDFEDSEVRQISPDCGYFLPIYTAFWRKHEEVRNQEGLASGYPEVPALSEANIVAQRVFMWHVVDEQSLTDEILKSIVREIAIPFVDLEKGLSYFVSGMEYCNFEQFPGSISSP